MGNFVATSYGGGAKKSGFGGGMSSHGGKVALNGMGGVTGKFSLCTGAGGGACPCGFSACSI